MGLLKKKDRHAGRPSKEGSSPDRMTPMGDTTPTREGMMPQPAFSEDSPVPDTPYPTELRLAVEAVAADGASSETSGGSDAYGLRAELEKSRGKTDDHVDVQPDSDAEAAAADEAAPFVPEGPALRLQPPPEPEPDSADPILEVMAEVELEPDLAPEDLIEPAPVVEEPVVEEPVAAAAAAHDVELEREAEPAPPTSGVGFASEARARLEAFERSIVEKTDGLRERAAELARRQEELAQTGDALDELEAKVAERQAALESHEAELQTREAALQSTLDALQGREAELRAEAERLEQEQAIWGEATRESRSRLGELQAAVEAKEQELREIESAHTSKASDLDLLAAELAKREVEAERLGAELDARQDRIGVVEDEIGSRQRALEEREQALRQTEDAVSEREAALTGREAALDQREAGVAEREASFEERESGLVARETELGAEKERLERDRNEWDDVMGAAFSRLNELETDLVSSLSLAGLLKRELEGREATVVPHRRPGPAPAGRKDAEDRRSAWLREENAQAPEPKPVTSLESSSSIPRGGGDPDKASENDWWARQLGRRKKESA
jgi:hypothetical protein